MSFPGRDKGYDHGNAKNDQHCHGGQRYRFFHDCIALILQMKTFQQGNHRRQDRQGDDRGIIAGETLIEKGGFCGF